MNNPQIRVRFAPSPTGYLHIGSLRTALFNYLFAKHNNGKFILRIEDTDQSRKVEGAVENLIKVLTDMGLQYDEGPSVGGDFGPYFQSQRLEIYKKYCDELISGGHAYYAFETGEELEEMRKVQQMQGKQTMYDRRARNFTESEVNEKLASGIPHVVRLKVPLNSEIKFDDIIRGTVKIETNLIDDQVLLKSDGFPTYHLANVIDDHLMNITHIIRGEEWLTSVPKHIILYNAFGWEVPKMAHVPLILNPDKTKLSKRQGDVATEDYLNKGYLKEALINFIALLGWNPGEGEKKEIFSLDELCSMFTLERVQSAGAVFNVEKLDWMNKVWMKNYDLENLTDLAIPYLKAGGFDVEGRKKMKQLVDYYRNKNQRLDYFIQLGELTRKKLPPFSNEQKEVLKSENSKNVLKRFLEKLKVLEDFSKENVNAAIKEIQLETGIKGKELYHPIRIALTGEDHGDDLWQVVQTAATLTGKTAVLNNIESALNG